MIKTNYTFPDKDNLEKQGQRLAQDLSLSMKSIKKQLETTQSSSFVQGTYSDLTFTFSGGSTQTQAHGLGVTPTGWMVVDMYAGGSAVTVVYPTRVSWDTNNISIYFSAGLTVTLKIRVFI